ncbi:hypothetical protein [Cohnella pontilimi]|uniref:hypothetical protein n=1 Tax=Cohnella pontilimi TaxID=2564100 RepID=UPI00145F0473|nr:hypothetical protein [Cohnella pontilimi]
MTKLEEYLKQNFEKGSYEYWITVIQDSEGKVHLYIHPLNLDGETLAFVAEGNYLIPNI